jgi:geranylgeranyl reductase family protein
MVFLLFNSLTLQKYYFFCNKSKKTVHLQNLNQGNMEKYDVIVIGAGPAGTAAAIFAKKQNRSVLLVDKAVFPREKICGDGLSMRTVNVLKALGLYGKFLDECPVNKIDGVIFSSPNGTVLPVNYAKIGRTKDVEGYTLNRIIFDHFLMNEARNAGVDVLENFCTKRFIFNKRDEICGICGSQTKSENEVSFEAEIVVCACGIFPKILKTINYTYPDSKKCVAGIKQYFKNVECEENMIEMHFVKSIVEGYFWIFPEKEKIANIGFIIPEKLRRKRKIDLKKELEKIMSSPKFAGRFRRAEAITKPKAAFLTLGGKNFFKPKARLLIIGDAMGLTDPFTGEGVGNAMFSAQKAAQVIHSAFESGDFSAKKMAMFHQICVNFLQKEFRISAFANKIKYAWLIDFVVGVAAKNSDVMMNIAQTVASHKDRKRLLNPLFYAKLLLKK